MSEFFRLLESYRNLMRENNDRIYLLLNDIIRRSRRDEELMYTLLRHYYIDPVHATRQYVPTSNMQYAPTSNMQYVPQETNQDPNTYSFTFSYPLNPTNTSNNEENNQENNSINEQQNNDGGTSQNNNQPDDNVITYNMDIQIEDERSIMPENTIPPQNMISRSISRRANLYSRPINSLYTIFSEVLDNVNLNNLESIPIVPTQEQINNAVETVAYSSIENPRNTSCSISLREFNNTSQVSRIKYCGHLFSPPSLTTHFTFDHRCPLCRYDIRNYVDSVDNEL